MKIYADTSLLFSLYSTDTNSAESIAATHTPTIGCRTLDVLHVAAAKQVGVAEFCTFDTRQADLVKRVGMVAVIP